MKRILVGLSLLVGACVGAPGESERTQAAIGPATVTTNQSVYQYADPVVVSFDGLNGNNLDWIAIAPVGSDFTNVTRWKYTSGTTMGAVNLEGPTPGGMYVARAFDDNGYTLMGESDPFSVADVSDTMATLMLDQADYAIDQNIVVTFTGMPPNQTDWVAITPVGSPDTKEALWKYTGGTANGTVTFPLGLALVSGTYYGGMYEARLYLHDTYTDVATSGPILIGSLVTTNKATYASSEDVTVSWTHLPGGPDDWVAISPVNADPNVVTQWLYTGGAANGSRTFTPGVAAPGQYVARTYAPNTYFVSGQSAPFDVTAGPTVTLMTDMPSYTAGQTITVSWSNTPGNANDWISIAPAGSPDSTVVRWVYTGGQASGSFAFEGVTAGSYVARAFLNNQYIKLGESAAFPVN
jgi:hypothetical protein